MRAELTRWLLPLTAGLLLAVPALAEEDDSSEEGEAGAEEGDSADESKEEGEGEGAETPAPPATEGEGEAAPGDAAPAQAEGAAVEAPAEPAEPKPEVSFVAEFGALWLHGNTKSVSLNGGAAFSLMHDRNKVALNAAGAYGRGVVGDLGWVEVAKKVGGALRYDRFLIPDKASLYLSGGAAHDPLAGFLVQARGDVGYSHTLLHSKQHSILLEGGFNYTRDQFTPEAGGSGQNFFGGRVFAGYALNVNDSFGFSESVEALLGGRENRDAGETGFDGRLVSTTAVTASVNKAISFKFGFTLNYDFVPPVNAATGVPFEALDTTASVALVATLL